MTDVSLWVFLLGWLGAARLTRLVVVDDLADPLHDALERRWRGALETFGSPDATEGDRARADRRYRHGKWLASLMSCYWCAGLWLFLGETGLAVVAEWNTGTWQVFGGAWWFTLPNAALGAHWIYALINFWADWGAHDKLAARRANHR